MTYSSYELKYCERCGGLGLRRSKSDVPYCCDCEQMLRALLSGAAPAARPGKLRRIVHGLPKRTLVPRSQPQCMPEGAHAS